ncbi:hypothetical protein GCM10010918_47680 [Paenibacillus radicis (ex Gao et al. 2016)]|uniref:SLH domain-containing protein n=2 Tax=Paenibacillus radicis (ex Gao et al. 2016) TaxID=1737354 RepID=A0A917M8M7_9BACL|nr:hypothetical protein GCM10010918_47680 [Paenibacillus radicis (ex Gao et al. 2016)]
MKKSLLAFVLAFSLVLSVAVPAFAATPSDAVGKKEQSAIEELVALGIINGYADGSFKPDNNITRAELAKIVVSATGGASAAALMQNVKPQFKDVKVNEWYTGFINVAATKGYIFGDAGTGKFRPNDNIKFEEVVAIIIRALGYNDKNLLGSWPYNVLVKAEDIELFKNVDIKPGTLATRAVVAQVTSNGLSQPLVKWDAEKQYYVAAGGILISKLGTSQEYILTSPKLDSAKKVQLNAQDFLTSDKFIVTGGKKLSELAGHVVNALLDKNNRVLALTDTQPAEDVVSGKLDAAIADYNVGNVVKVKVGDDVKEYTVSTATYFYKNGEKIATITDKDAAKDATVQVFLNNDVQVRAIVVKEYDVNNAVFTKYIEKGSSASARIQIEGSVAFVNVNDNTVVTLNGEAAKVADLKENDVLKVLRNSSNEAVEINANRDVVSGKVTAIETVKNQPVYTVNGTSYKDVRGVLNPSVAIDGEYKFFLNADKEIVKVSVVTPGAQDNNVAVLFEYLNNKDVVNSKGIVETKDVVTYYSVKEDKIVTVQLDSAKADRSADAGKYVKLVFDGDKVVDLNLVGAQNLKDVNTVEDKTATTVKVKIASVDKTFSYNGNTIVFDATGVFNAAGNVKDDAKIVKTTIDKVTKSDQVTVVTDAGNYYAQYIFLVKDNETAENRLPVAAGKFVTVNKVQTASGSTYSVKLKVSGEEKSFPIAWDAAATGYTDLYSKLLTLNADDNVFVALSDSSAAPGTKYNTADVVYVKGQTANNALTADSNYGTFTVSNTAGSFIHTDKTQVFVIDKNDNVSVGGFVDIANAASVNAANYDAFVAAGSAHLGNNTEGAIVVIKYFN